MTDTHTDKAAAPVGPMTDAEIDIMKAALEGATDGEWFGANMTHAEGRPLTPEEIGEYICGSVKLGTPGRFLFVGVEGSDIAHFGNGPSGEANATLAILSKRMAAEVTRLRAVNESLRNAPALPVQTHDADTVERVAKALAVAQGIDFDFHDIHRDDQTDLMNEARAALSAMPPQEVSVKPLEWWEPKKDNNYTHGAKTIFGTYYVGICGGRHSAHAEFFHEGGDIEQFLGPDRGTVEEAKMDAVRHHQGRIMSSVTMQEVSVPANTNCMIVYEDAEVEPDYFSDFPAAKATYEMKLTNWTCHLFVDYSSLRALSEGEA